MKTILLIALAGGMAFAGTAPAAAAQGCGPGGHRGYHGYCRPNRGTVIVAPPRPVIGVYYTGHGYWDGHRYWGHRYRYNRGWRYR